MRIALICNDPLGLPALQHLVQNRLVQAVATSDRAPEMIAILKLVKQQGGVPTRTFSKRNFEADLIDWLKQYQPDVVLVMTFPFLIPATALSIPKHGFINFHYAPLPEYRGSNPLFWMIKEGKKMGGVTVHKMDERFDTGPILFQESVEFPSNVTFGLATKLLGQVGARLAIQLINGISRGTLQEIAQTLGQFKWHGRPQSVDLIINWKNMSSSEIISLINACNPWLKGAPTSCKGIPIHIANATLLTDQENNSIVPGEVLEISSKALIVACKDRTALKIEVVYLEQGFYPGSGLLEFGLNEGDIFGR